MKKDDGEVLRQESLGELGQGDDLEIENHSNTEDDNESLDSQKISSFNKQVLQNNRPQEALIKSPQKQAIPGKFQVVETAKNTKRGTRNPNDSSDDEVDVGDELK